LAITDASGEKTLAQTSRAYHGAMIRRETLRNRALKSAIGAIVVYGIAFYAFDLPDWLKLTARIILGAVALYVVAPLLRAFRRRRVRGYS